MQEVTLDEVERLAENAREELWSQSLPLIEAGACKSDKHR